MFKVTMFRLAQFGQGTPSVNPAPEVKARPATLLQELESDLFTRQALVQTGNREDSLTCLELRFGDLKPSTLMVLDEIQRLLTRLSLQEGRQVELSALKTKGIEPEEHVLLEAAHEGIYEQLLKALHGLGAVRSSTKRADQANWLKYADVSVLLFERGLENEQLPEPVRQIKQARESLGRSNTVQTAAGVLANRLSKQGLSDVLVHPLELQPPGQLWVLYPVAEKPIRDMEQEQKIRGAITLFPETDMVDGKLAFRQDDKTYSISIAPHTVQKPHPPERPRHYSIKVAVSSLFIQGWNNLVHFLQGLRTKTA